MPSCGIKKKNDKNWKGDDLKKKNTTPQFFFLLGNLKKTKFITKHSLKFYFTA